MRSGGDWARLRRRTVTPSRHRAHARQHATIADGIAARDPGGAAAAMRAHLLEVEAAMTGLALSETAPTPQHAPTGDAR